MKQIFYRAIVPILIVALSVTLFGCNDQWDDHYSGGLDNLSEYDLYEFIQLQPELSSFAQLLETSGFDTIISASQTYTVWAPNNVSLAGVDLNDKEIASTIVRNHIARGIYTTSGTLSKPVNLLNGKYVAFTRDGSGQFTYGNAGIVQPNARTKNGLVHVIDPYVPYTPNIWEYLTSADNLDSLRAYLNSLTQNVFVPSLSVEIGKNEEGNPVYDSVFVARNKFMQELGTIDDEDSLYTAVLLNNNAWNQAYERVLPYFNVPEIYGGEKRKEALTRSAMVQDLIFRDLVEVPTSHDSLVSTYGSVFYKPFYLFNGAQKVELSNGLGYVMNGFVYPDTLSWFKEIRVEGENAEGRLNANSDVILGSSLGSGLDVSERAYMLLQSTGASNFAKSSVTFSIPNTLSAKYNIYVMFVPASISDPANLTPSKVSFQLVYVSTTTGRTTRLRVTPENNVTNPNGLTKMFVTQMDFDFANVIDEDFESAGVTLQVINEVTIAEESAGSFSRSMRIDCVIFEPVIE